ncbi:MAG: hypothetical protein EOS23_26760 [Mesorhizobium sp.]|nr:MAG: hypothetical protein EOS23_26760 [Mesorhizobium sp.]
MGDRFAFKTMLPQLSHVFSYLGPTELVLSAEQEAELVRRGYEMDKWNAGELLTVNGMMAASSDEPFRFSPLGIRRLVAVPPEAFEDEEIEPIPPRPT